MSDEPLFVVDYSTDELALLADLLEVDALPLGPSGSSLSDEVRAAVSRGLVARGVLNILGPDEVELTQPHASIFGVVRAADQASDLVVVTKERLRREVLALGDGHTAEFRMKLPGIVQGSLFSGYERGLGPDLSLPSAAPEREIPLPKELVSHLEQPTAMGLDLPPSLVDELGCANLVAVRTQREGQGSRQVDYWLRTDSGTWVASGATSQDMTSLRLYANAAYGIV